jgi:hypothetical protein
VNTSSGIKKHQLSDLTQLCYHETEKYFSIWNRLKTMIVTLHTL